MSKIFCPRCGKISEVSSEYAGKVSCGDCLMSCTEIVTMLPLLNGSQHVKRTGIFRDHRCAKCNDGERACVNGSPNRCDWPRARNE